MRPSISPAKFLTVAAFVIWLSAATAGGTFLKSHALRPAPAGVPPKTWPSASALQPEPGLPTLVLLAHPQCACTRASLDELALMMAKLQGRLKAYVVFYQPAGLPADWVETDSWRMAEQIPGVTVMRDLNGEEARRFGAEASGQTLLYDAQSHLRFSGGITWARGHRGDNAGRSAIVELVLTGNSIQDHTPTYGCAIVGRSEPRGSQHVVARNN